MIDLSSIQPFAEGKTKLLYQVAEDFRAIHLRNKDDITIGDGECHWVIPGKAILVTAITCATFDLLNQAGIRTHYMGLEDPITFRAKKANPFKIEVVIRASAQGSYLKRHPDVQPGTVFPKSEVELFYKNDEEHDPLMVWDEENDAFALHEAKKPLGTAFLRYLEPDPAIMPASQKEFDCIRQDASFAFDVVHKAYAKLGYDMPDGKLEYGRFWNSQDIGIIDVFDCESFRMTKNGQEISKEVLRKWHADGINIAEEHLRVVLSNYADIASVSNQLQLAA